MNRVSATPDERFAELAVRFLNSDLSSAESADFCQRLTADPDARALYVDLCLQARLISESLSQRARGGADWQDAPASLETASPDPADMELASLDSTAFDSSLLPELDTLHHPTALPAAVRSPVLGYLQDVIRSFPCGEWAVGVLVIGAVCCEVWGVMYIQNHELAEKPTAVPGESAIPSVAVKQDNRPPLATLTAAANCLWRSTDLPTDVSARLAAGELELAEGLAEITFNSGARVTLEGPAWLRLRGEMRPSCFTAGLWPTYLRQPADSLSARPA